MKNKMILFWGELLSAPCHRYIRGILAFVCIYMFSNAGFAQPEVQKPARILFLLDASSSMGNSWINTDSRFQTAGRIVNTIVDSIHHINPDVAFAIRVFGNQFPAQEKNCFDSKLEVPFNLSNDGQIRARLKYLNPRGFSPIAWSLQQAAELDFKEDNRYAYSIILITDGGESCGGDICATVANLLNKKISFKPYILSLIDYAPLKAEYACLGKYITVATEKDIPLAVNTIINDNRKVLMIKTTDYHPIAISTPPPKASDVSLPKIITIPKPEPVKETVVKTEAPVEKNEPATETTPDRKKIVPVDYIYTRSKLQKLNLLYTIADATPVKVPLLKPIKFSPVPDVIPQTPVAANTTPKAANKIVEPSVATERPRSNSAVKKPEPKGEAPLTFETTSTDAKESSVQVYFTNGKGKFYRTEPKLIFKDSKTQAEVKSVYRNLEGGEPAPIKMEPGTYDLSIVKSKRMVKNITIEAGKNKKVYITVPSGNLEFFYPSAPNRPVKEYQALVSKRFEAGPVVKQKCDTIMSYEPASYHIEINTLPAMMVFIELDFSASNPISIPEAGTVQITNTNNKGRVQFWYQQGDSYKPFYEMNVTGNTAAQKVDFLPGMYQVRYFNGPQTPLAKADVVLFRVKSNMVTNIELQ